MEGIIAILLLFGAIPIIILFAVWVISNHRYKTRNRMADVLQQYATSGKEPPTDLVKSIGLPFRQPHTDLRRGLIAIAIGLATCVLGLVTDGKDETAGLLGLSAFPIFIGLALLGFWYFVGRKTENV